MATNEERRAVAAKLRDSVPDGRFSPGDSGWGMLYRVLFGRYIPSQPAVHTFAQVVDKLADLIEPAPTSSDTTPTSSDTTPTSDRDTLLALADELEAQQANKGIERLALTCSRAMQPAASARRAGRREMSEWEVAERRARIDHIERLLRRGASVVAVLDEMPDATRKDAETAKKRVSKHGNGRR